MSSQLIYQTNLVAGALLLAGLLVVSATAGRKPVLARDESKQTREGDEANPGISVEVPEGLKSDIQWLDREIENEFQALFQSVEEPQTEEVVTSHTPGSPRIRLVTVSDSSTFAAVVGPAIVAIGYLAVSAILLPGAGIFLTTNFQLNTAAILALSYGWPGLGIYALLSVYLALRPAREERRTQ